MHAALQTVCDYLDGLAEYVLNSWSNDVNLNANFGWNHPSVTRHDLADIPRQLSLKIRQTGISDIDQAMSQYLSTLPAKIEQLQKNTVPNFYNGNGAAAIPAFLVTMDAIRNNLYRLIEWEVLVDKGFLPVTISRRLKYFRSEIERIAPDIDSLSSNVALINEATGAAESLPTDMQALGKAKNDIEKICGDVANRQKNVIESEAAASSIHKNLSTLQEKANKIVESCDDAYRVATSTGLAGAFDKRAKDLQRSIGYWVVGLLCALAAGAYLGSERIQYLSREISSDMEWGRVLLHTLISVISVGAPLWFAWLSTKQIGQRFQLAEDYAFKSSIAKAYEGYRREAVNVDPMLISRLFNSALLRLEEAPLRLIDRSNHGSPWHEALDSETIKNVMSILADKCDSVLSSVGKNASKKSTNKNVGSGETTTSSSGDGGE